MIKKIILILLIFSSTNSHCGHALNLGVSDAPTQNEIRCQDILYAIILLTIIYHIDEFNFGPIYP